MVLRCGSTSCGNKWKKKLHLKNQPGLWPNSVLHLLIHMLWLKLGYTPGYNLKIRPTLKIGYVPLPAVIEQSWLSWLRHNQGKLCVAQLNGIMDAAHAGDHLSNVGQHFILPSSHIGSPWSMFQFCQDSYAIAAAFGPKPDLFITATSNPQWEDIWVALLHGQIWSDHPC